MDFISGRASLSGSVRAVFWGIGYCIRGRSSAIVSGGRNRGIVSKDFALNPGVYRIIVESDIANGGIGSGMEISLEAEETTFRAIRATGQLCLQIQSIKGLPIMWQIRLMQHICRYSHFRREEMFPMSESREDNRRKKDPFCNSAGSFCLSGWNCDIPQKSIV